MNDIIKLGNFWDVVGPDFSLSDQDGNIRTLADYKGKWVLLYFYPKDFTSGCTVEACSIRDNFHEQCKLATVLGVSADSIESHKKFAEQYNLPFHLLSDPERTLIASYGVTKRTSFLIGPSGHIAKIYETVSPATHAAQVLDDLKKFLID